MCVCFFFVVLRNGAREKSRQREIDGAAERGTERVFMGLPLSTLANVRERTN